MITAEKLRLLTNMRPDTLTTGIQQSGHKKDKFETAEFLGMSNGKQFVYMVSYNQDNEVQKCKVFVSYDSTTDAIKFNK